MKQFFIFLLLLTGFISCQKEQTAPKVTTNTYLQNVQTALRDSLSNADYGQLDFSKSVLSKTDSVQLYYLRIPFKEKELKNDFVLVKTTKSGKIWWGKIIHLEGNISAYGEGPVKRNRFDGNVSIASLNRGKILHSAITNGYVEAFHKEAGNNTLRESEYEELPEVVVTAYVSSPSYYIMWDTFGGGGSNGYYGDGSNTGEYAYGGGGGSGSDITEEPLIEPSTNLDGTESVCEKSFKFKKYISTDPVTGIGGWQVCGVSNLHINVFDLVNRVVIRIQLPPMYFGLPISRLNGDYYSTDEAARKAAEAVEKAETDVMDYYKLTGGAVDITKFTSLYKKQLDAHMKESAGSATLSPGSNLDVPLTEAIYTGLFGLNCL